MEETTALHPPLKKRKIVDSADAPAAKDASSDPPKAQEPVAKPHKKSKHSKAVEKKSHAKATPSISAAEGPVDQADQTPAHVVTPTEETPKPEEEPTAATASPPRAQARTLSVQVTPPPGVSPSLASHDSPDTPEHSHHHQSHNTSSSSSSAVSHHHQHHHAHHSHHNNTSNNNHHKDASSYHDDASDDETLHPEHIRLRSAGVALYDDDEIDGLWDRLTKENQRIMFKQFLKRHPEHIGQLYVVADRESNFTELIHTKFEKFDRKMDRVIRPNADSWNDLEEPQRTTEALKEYRQSLENRSENADLDRLVRDALEFLHSFLDVCASYIQRGKLKLSLLILTVLVSKFSSSRLCSENYLIAEEERSLSHKVAKCAQRFLDNESQPKAIKANIFYQIYSFCDKIMSDEVRASLQARLKEMGAPEPPSTSST